QRRRPRASAGGQAPEDRRGIAPCRSPALAAQMEVAQAAEQRGVVYGGHVNLARDPSEKITIRDLQQSLELGKLGVVELFERAIGEATHDEIRLTHAAMPRAK